MAGPRRQGKGPRRAKSAVRRKATGKKRTRSSSAKQAYTEADAIKALNHVARRQILRLLHDTDGPRSPVRCAEKLGHRLTNVAYHFKVLFDHKIIAPDGTAPARGATEHFYVSNAAENPAIIEMLERTRKVDELS